MPTAKVLLYWLPLGAGGHSVRWNGRLYEAYVARREHRPAQALYHAALEVWLGDERTVIEVTPAWGTRVAERGVVSTGPVGVRWLGRFVAFRYEVRRWPMGVIPDAAEAVDSPRLVGCDPEQARRLLDLVPQVPALTWGRDESRTGDMWNSNSVVAWLLTGSGHDATSIAPPAGGRAPGWNAGLVVAEGTTHHFSGQGCCEPVSGRGTCRSLEVLSAGAQILANPSHDDELGRREDASWTAASR